MFNFSCLLEYNLLISSPIKILFSSLYLWYYGEKAHLNLTNSTFLIPWCSRCCLSLDYTNVTEVDIGNVGHLDSAYSFDSLNLVFVEHQVLERRKGNLWNLFEDEFMICFDLLLMKSTKLYFIWFPFFYVWAKLTHLKFAPSSITFIKAILTNAYNHLIGLVRDVNFFL